MVLVDPRAHPVLAGWCSVRYRWLVAGPARFGLFRLLTAAGLEGLRGRRPPEGGTGGAGLSAALHTTSGTLSRTIRAPVP